MAGLGKPTLIFIEIKQEAGHAGDAQQEGMAYYAHACKMLTAATTHTLLPAVLMTVRSTVVFFVWPLFAGSAAVACAP